MKRLDTKKKIIVSVLCAFLVVTTGSFLAIAEAQECDTLECQQESFPTNPWIYFVFPYAPYTYTIGYINTDPVDLTIGTRDCCILDDVVEIYVDGCLIGVHRSVDGIRDAYQTVSLKPGTHVIDLVNTFSRISASGWYYELVASDWTGIPWPCLSLEKEIVDGPEQIEIYLPEPTRYVFEIVYTGPPALIEDAVPAEFEVTDTDASDGTVSADPAGKGPKSKSATIITWNVPAGSSTLTVDIQTRESPGGGHKFDTYKPTSCEQDFELNDGAMAYQVDENGDPILDQDGNMIPIEGLEGGSAPLTVDAVCGAKPCAPENLSVTLTPPTTLSLNWDDVDCGGPEVRYNVYRDGEQIAGPLVNSEYTDSGRTPGVEYCYEIEAEYVPPGDGLESDKSDEVCYTVPDP
ncbi:MAG: hypothetical protein ACYTBX_14680 [Planctomycetota bacterium]|jgi:hypothetical protein